jgi:alpha 1,3-glucosidase
MKMRLRRSSALMFRDPFTLIVAVDAEGRAEGELYVDDGDTLEFGKGQFLYKKFEFDNRTFTSSDIGEGVDPGFREEYDVEVDEIRIAGIGRAPTGIKDAAGKSIEFSEENETVLIVQPGLLVRDNWQLTFDF